MKIRRKNHALIFMASIILSFLLVPLQSFPQGEKEKKSADVQPKAESPAFSIEENMRKFYSKLDRLEEKYKECCGSLVGAYATVDLNRIAEGLPKPKTLRINIKYPLPPWKLQKEISKNRIFVQRFDNSDLYAPHPFSFRVPGSPLATYRAAATDYLTSTILGIPQEIGLRLGQSDIVTESGPEKSTCCLDPQWDGGELKTCRQFAQQYSYVTATDFHPVQLKLKAEIKGGGEALGGGLGFKFSTSGEKEIDLESPMKIDFDKKYCNYTECVHGTPNFLVRCEPAGTVKSTKPLKITAVTLKAFGIPGLDFQAGIRPPQLDYFLMAGEPGFNKYTGFKRPAVLVDDGKTTHTVYGFGEEIITSYGPVMLSPSAQDEFALIYNGGIGSTKFKTRLSTLEGKEHEITVNAVEMVFDPIMISEGEPYAYGGRKYKLTLLVNGPAKMENYRVAWRGQVNERLGDLKGASVAVIWDRESTEFVKVGNLWSSANTFQINYEGYDPRTSKGFLNTLIESRILRKNDDHPMYEYRKSIRVLSPAISELKLYTSTDGKSFSEPRTGIDIFRAPLAGNFRTRDVYVYPYVVLMDRSIRALDEFTRTMVELKHTNPGVLRLAVSEKRDQSRYYKVEGASAGRTDIIARIGRDLNKENCGIAEGDEVKSKPVRFNVNIIQPVTVVLEGKKRTYRLSIESPTFFEDKYRAVWIGKKERTVTPFVDEGFYSNATVSTDSEINTIQIIDGSSEVVASMDVDEKSNMARIKLLPPDIPVTTVKKTELTDYGAVESLNQCIDTVTFGMKHLGFEPGKTPDEYCRQERKEKKEEIARLRESQKETNKLVKELERQGKELVVFADKATVGAVVEVAPSLDKKGIFCHWTLVDAHAQLRLTESISPVQWGTENKGGCFNVIEGIQKYLTPEAKVQAELRMETKHTGKVEVVSPSDIILIQRQ